MQSFVKARLVWKVNFISFHILCNAPDWHHISFSRCRFPSHLETMEKRTKKKRNSMQPWTHNFSPFSYHPTFLTYVTPLIHSPSLDLTHTSKDNPTRATEDNEKAGGQWVSISSSNGWRWVHLQWWQWRAHRLIRAGAMGKPTCERQDLISNWSRKVCPLLDLISNWSRKVCPLIENSGGLLARMIVLTATTV